VSDMGVSVRCMSDLRVSENEQMAQSEGMHALQVTIILWWQFLLSCFVPFHSYS
jgi:hypothetical protein